MFQSDLDRDPDSLPGWLPPILFGWTLAGTAGAKQGSTTAAISGTVRAANHGALNHARITMVDRATGFSVTAFSSAGNFTIQGLRVGGPYSLAVQLEGYQATALDSIYLALDERRHLDIQLTIWPAVIAALVVTAERNRPENSASNGIRTSVSDSALHRLPASDRDYYDFVRLAPGISGVSARTGISGGGVGIRFNSFLIDGVSDRGLPRNLAAGTGAGGKAIPIDAVKEYEVLLSPFDPRYGDFAGVVINAITRSGTNDRTAMAFVYRRDRL